MIYRTPGRPGVTLIEVLVSIFIMGIGMLALLVLFPLGAIQMGRALRNDRASSAAALADAIALTQDIRHDPVVLSDATVANAFTNPFGTPLTTMSGPSFGVFVDPFGFLVDTTGTVGALPGVTPGIRRRSMSLVNFTARNAGGPPFAPLTAVECGRWCTLLDDLVFNPDATPTAGSAAIERGGAYTWAWLLRQPLADLRTLPAPGYGSMVEVSVVVYRGRAVQTPGGETTYPVVTGAMDTNSVVLDYTGLPVPNLRTGVWVLDTTQLSPPNGPVPGYFYRVVDYLDLGNNKYQLELETPLKNNATAMTVMEDVVEVFDRSAGWQP